MARSVNCIRKRKAWSQYALWLTQTAQDAARQLGVIDRLHILNYRSSFQPDVAAIIDRDPEGVVWL